MHFAEISLLQKGTMSTPRNFRRVVIASMLLVASLAGSAFAADGRVLPANAKPSGFSLEKMAQLMALFDTSGNDLAYYPDTPFQLLYLNATNTFAVHRGTTLFVPLIFITDSPPVLGDFPDGEKDVEDYVYDETELGADLFEIVVDGKATSLSADYIAGPVHQPGLLDGGGSHMIQVGAFISPLGKGTHTVTIRATLDGEAVLALLGGPFLVDDTYTVVVR